MLVKPSLVTSGPPVQRGLISRQGCYGQQCFGHHKSLRNSLVHASSHLFGWAMPVLGYSHLMHTCLHSPSRKAGAQDRHLPPSASLSLSPYLRIRPSLCLTCKTVDNSSSLVASSPNLQASFLAKAGCIRAPGLAQQQGETRRVSSADASKRKLLLRPSSIQDLKPNTRDRYILCTETQVQHCIRVSTARRHAARSLPGSRADLTKDIVCTQPQGMNLDVQRTDTSTLQAQPGRQGSAICNLSI